MIKCDSARSKSCCKQECLTLAERAPAAKLNSLMHIKFESSFTFTPRLSVFRREIQTLVFERERTFRKLQSQSSRSTRIQSFHCQMNPRDDSS